MRLFIKLTQLLGVKSSRILMKKKSDSIKFSFCRESNFEQIVAVQFFWFFLHGNYLNFEFEKYFYINLYQVCEGLMSLQTCWKQWTEMLFSHVDAMCIKMGNCSVIKRNCRIAWTEYERSTDNLNKTQNETHMDNK